MNENSMATKYQTPLPGLTDRDNLEQLFENGGVKGYRFPVPGGWLYVTTLTLGGSATGSISSTFVAERGR